MNMTWWRKVVVPAVVIASAVAGVQGVANARPETGAWAEVSAVGTQADGAALLRGVFFMQGDIGSTLQKLPYVSSDPAMVERNSRPDAVAEVDRMLVDVEQARPGHLADFSRRMRSGDPFQVEAAMVDSGTLIQRLTDTRTMDMGTQVGTQVYVETAYVVAIGIFVAAVVAIVFFGVVRTHPRSGTQPLEKERMMAVFATELKRV